MELSKKKLLILEVLWQAKGGVDFVSISYYLSLKFCPSVLRLQFPIEERLSVLDDLVGESYVGKSIKSPESIRRQLKSCNRQTDQGPRTRKYRGLIFTITRRGIMALLDSTGYHSARYFEVEETKHQKKGLKKYVVRTSNRSRMEEITTILRGLTNYYGTLRNIRTIKKNVGWTTRLGVHSKAVHCCELDFTENRTMSMEGMRLAHQVLFRNTWWRQIGYESEECLFRLSLSGQLPVQVGEKYWGECKDVLEKSAAENYTSVQVPSTLGWPGEHQAELLFREFPWETTFTSDIDNRNRITFCHRTVGSADLLLGFRKIGTISCPGSYRILYQTSVDKIEIAQESPRVTMIEEPTRARHWSE